MRTNPWFRGLELSVLPPSDLLGEERVLEVESITNGQWFNQPYLPNGIFMKSPKQQGLGNVHTAEHIEEHRSVGRVTHLEKAGQLCV